MPQSDRGADPFYHSLVESIPQSIFRKDQDGRFTFGNSRFCDAMGLSLGEIIGKTDKDFFPPETAEKYQADDRAVMAGHAFDEVEYHPSASGARYVHVVKTPVYDADGTCIGIQGIFWDVTERKLAEEELALARDAAVESARVKAEFLANMSHEIRTPLNAVVGMSDLLLQTKLDGEQQEFANTIRISADLLLGIVNDILDFSKIEAGKMTIENIDFDFSRTLEDAADMVADRAQRKGIELAVAIHPGVPAALRGDPNRIRQVLCNLLSNAVKFTEHGEVVLQAEMLEEHSDKVTIRLEVRDTGIGIPLEAQPRLFAAFTQADGSTTRRYGGTGLGLAISKRLVGLMGGELGFTSKPGLGTTFWITLTLDRAESQAVLASRADVWLDGIRVLIVDDNETNRDILKRQTRSWRMRNDTASSGPEALALLYKAAAAGDPYEVVILDMQMPDMDGMSVTRAIKADPLHADVRIVILTSLAYHPDEVNSRSLGIAAYQTKPIKQSRLLDCLATVLSEKSPAARPARRPPVSVDVAKSKSQPAPANALRILLAEDNEVNRRVAHHQLRKLGYTADCVTNGAEVLEAIARKTYDVILMDGQMPVMDGYQATGAIREREGSAPGAPRHHIIAITANSLDGDREKCLKAGMDDYLSKPIRIEELSAVLERGAAAVATRTGVARPAVNS